MTDTQRPGDCKGLSVTCTGSSDPPASSGNLWQRRGCAHLWARVPSVIFSLCIRKGNHRIEGQRRWKRDRKGLRSVAPCPATLRSRG